MARASQSLEAGATPEECFAAIRDFERYPDWASSVQAVRLLGDDVVEFHIDAKVRKVRYVLRYFFEEPGRVWWEYVEGDVKSVEGEYLIEPAGAGRTRLTYSLELDPGVPLPGLIKRVLVNTVMKGSVEDLKRYVES